MPVIKNSANLSNSYREISDLCHKYREPVFLTKDGDGDLAVMSMETYEELAGMNDLYRLLQTGLDDVKNGRVVTKEELHKNIARVLNK